MDNPVGCCDNPALVAGLEANVWKELREARFSSQGRAAMAVFDALREAGKPGPTPGSIERTISRVESGHTTEARAEWWPLYADMLGIETQTPTLRAVSESVDQRMEALTSQIELLTAQVAELRRALGDPERRHRGRDTGSLRA